VHPFFVYDICYKQEKIVCMQKNVELDIDCEGIALYFSRFSSDSLS